MKYLLSILFLFIYCFGFAQQAEYVDFKRAKSDIFIKPSEKLVEGVILYEFEVLKDIDSVFIDGKKMTFSNVALHRLGVHIDAEYADVKFHNDSKRLLIYNEFKKGEDYRLTIDYSANPKKAMYFIGWDSVSLERWALSEVEVSGGIDSISTRLNTQKKQIWTQGQGKYTSNWLPSIDDMNDKIEFDLSITFDKDYEVIANGRLTDKQINQSTTTWHYDMQKPMSSYLVALAIGKYDKKVEYSKSGIPLEMYYYPEDTANFEPTYRYTKQMFNFLEEEIGVLYPWQNYKQVPVKDFLYAGMENTSTTIFSDAFVVDSIGFVDKNYVNVNAHELAHQWFGDLVTETSGTHHWLQEGFATYYALLAEKEVFGEDYYYWRLYEYAQELQAQDKAGHSTSLLDPKSSSITFYKKGAWVLHILRERVGDKAFRKAVKNYLEEHQFKNVETEDFISEVEKGSGENLDEFIELWLKKDKFHYEVCLGYLKGGSSEIDELIKLNQELMFSSHSLDYSINRYWKKANSSRIKSDLFSKNSIETIHDSIIRKALKSKDIKVRQAIAQSLSKIPLELKADYETLLNDKSYITIETALFNLWKSFPEDRNRYLNKTKNIHGFNDKNVRMLWLTLALITEDFELQNKKQYFEELINYTNSKYGFEIRQNAFQYLTQIKACNEKCKENLIQATKHHNWRFSKFAKTLLEAE